MLTSCRTNSILRLERTTQKLLLICHHVRSDSFRNSCGLHFSNFSLNLGSLTGLLLNFWGFLFLINLLDIFTKFSHSTFGRLHVWGNLGSARSTRVDLRLLFSDFSFDIDLIMLHFFPTRFFEEFSDSLSFVSFKVFMIFLLSVLKIFLHHEIK